MLPASICRIACTAPATSAVKMPAPRPYSISLAIAIAAAMSGAADTATPGPNNSSCENGDRGSTAATTAGLTTAPSRSPPVSTFAPDWPATWIAEATRIASASEISEPSRVASSAGSPMAMASTLGTRASRKSPSTRSSTITRCTEIHTCPALMKPPAATAEVATSISASGNTITGHAAPNSNDNFLIPATAAMCAPVAVEPVNVTFRTRGSVTSRSPNFPPGPVTTDNAPGGRPASTKHCASLSAVNGVDRAGFNTTALPAASAGAILCSTVSAGKLNGLIATMIPHGCRSVKPIFSKPVPVFASSGNVEPYNWLPSKAANRINAPDRPASPRASLIGLPDSALSVCAISSTRSSTKSAARNNTANRSNAGVSRCTPAATTAPSMAAAASSTPPTGTEPTTCPSNGDRTSSVAPPAAPHHLPPSSISITNLPAQNPHPPTTPNRQRRNQNRYTFVTNETGALSDLTAELSTS